MTGIIDPGDQTDYIEKQKKEQSDWLKENVPKESFVRDKEGPTEWTNKAAQRQQSMGHAGPDRDYTGSMFNRDTGASHSQNNAMEQFLRGRAEGKDLISDRAARQMTDQTRRGIASQAQGTGTRYNPAVQMAATRAQASAGQNLAAQTSVAKAQEQAAAQQAYMAAQAGIRGQDQSALQAGLAAEGQNIDYQKFMENLAAQYKGLGVSESFQDKANEQLYIDRVLKTIALMNDPNYKGDLVNGAGGNTYVPQSYVSPEYRK